MGSSKFLASDLASTNDSLFNKVYFEKCMFQDYFIRDFFIWYFIFWIYLNSFWLKILSNSSFLLNFDNFIVIMAEFSTKIINLWPYCFNKYCFIITNFSNKQRVSKISTVKYSKFLKTIFQHDHPLKRVWKRGWLLHIDLKSVDSVKCKYKYYQLDWEK
jgi:hypothetical protein